MRSSGHAGETLSLNRVARLMRVAGVEGVHWRRKGKKGRREPEVQPAADPVGRDFSASGPDELWVADINYIPTKAGTRSPGGGSPTRPTTSSIRAG